MNVPHKWPFYDHFWPFFRLLYVVHFSQNWGSDGHFEVLNGSKFWLVQKLWHKTKIFPFPFFAILYKNTHLRLFMICHHKIPLSKHELSGKNTYFRCFIVIIIKYLFYQLVWIQTQKVSFQKFFATLWDIWLQLVHFIRYTCGEKWYKSNDLVKKASVTSLSSYSHVITTIGLNNFLNCIL